MSGLFASLSVGRAWEKLTYFIRAFSTPSAPSSSCSASQDDVEELMKLERTMRRVRATLHDAEEHWNIREESSKLRLQELKDLAYDMEDVVDEYEYEVNRCKVEALERDANVYNTNKRKRQEQNEAYSMDVGVVPVPKELVLRAGELTARFNEIIDFSDRFNLSENDGERCFSHDVSDLRHTSSFVFEKTILGRDQDRDKIVEKLLSESKNIGSHVSVMAIVGMGGVGKTTLAQLVYNCPRVRQSFDKYAWVCVSEPFNISTITRNIIISLIERRTCEYTELADLQGRLADEIKDKKVLLVLDDVWNERRDCWNLLCTPMSVTRFCQIVVTTRSERVARLIQTMPLYHLNCLSTDESWSLFKQAAFSVDQESKTLENLTEIGKRIVIKCNGLPLAIKTIGSMLRYETDEKIWEDVLENELLELEQTRNEVLPILELCYKHMPVYLRRCFIALSLYPKDTSLQNWEIICLWKSLDLLNWNGSDDENETGSLYLKELGQRSILQTEDYIDDLYICNMHDLVHDLACYLSSGEFFRLEGDTLVEIPQNVRYISVPYSHKSVEMPTLPHSLRAFILLGVINIINPESLFLSCKNLRALDLRHRSVIEALSNFMDSLKLIRHLTLGDSGETQFPGSISLFQSYNLQTLEHYLIGRGNMALRGIEHLINLRTLGLHIGRCGCSCNIRELRNINKLSKLSISGLDGVSCIEDANEAQMQSKKQLRSLYLNFTVRDILQSEPVTLPHDQLLESLQPHRSLIELTIVGYESHKYPSWLGNDSFSKLTRIRLLSCGSKHLPPLGGLPSLKELRIEGMRNVEHIGWEFSNRPSKGFPSLTDIEFARMENWLEWSGVDDGVFVCLRTLSITECYKLNSLPMVPFLPLVTVNLHNCDIAIIPAWITLRKLTIRLCGSLSEVPTFPSFLDLHLGWCPKLRAVGSQPSLTSMELNSINPTSVGFGSLPSLTSLELVDVSQICRGGSGTTPKYELYIPFCDLPSLECIKIRDHSVTCLRLKQQGLPSLTRICLLRCPFLDGLSGLTSLQHLEVRQCPKLTINDLQLTQLKTLVQ